MLAGVSRTDDLNTLTRSLARLGSGSRLIADSGGGTAGGTPVSNNFRDFERAPLEMPRTLVLLWSSGAPGNGDRTSDAPQAQLLLLSSHLTSPTCEVAT